MTKDPYLIPYRLEDVIFLIQYLGLGVSFSLQQNNAADGVNPRSAESWMFVAKDHPEFFRVTDAGSVNLSLRFFLFPPGEGRVPAPIEIALVQQLVVNAIALQERQAKRSEVWKILGTFIAATVAAAVGIAQLFLSHK